MTPKDETPRSQRGVCHWKVVLTSPKAQEKA